jgi:hypothetical protein
MLMGKPKITKSQMLSAKPARLSEAEPQKVTEQKFHLTVTLKPTAIARWLMRAGAGAGATKTFELDPLGLFVWEACDGKTPVRQLIKRLAKHFEINAREAEVSTLQFLHTLARKGLIGMQITGGDDKRT